MSLAEWWESWTVVQLIGWVLVHFLWQGAVVAAVVAVVLRAMRDRNADGRYLVCLAGLAAMMAAPVITVVVLLRTRTGMDESVLPPMPLDLSVTESLWGQLGSALPAVTGTWLVGTILFQARLILNFSRARRLRLEGTRPASRAWRRVGQELCDRMGIRLAVRVVESSLADVPTLIGWLRPVILLPTTALTGLSPAQLRAIIAHELAHVRRHDYAVNVIQSVLETVLFYHPALWWLSGRLRIEREYCCDDVAVSVCGDALCYAQALSSLDALRVLDAQPALASTGGSLMDRIRRLAHARSAPPRRNGALIAPLVMVLALTVSLSALVVNAKVDEKSSDAADAAVENIDVVGILEHMGSDHAGMIDALARAGLDNDVLITVLDQLGVEDEVMGAIERASSRARFVESSLDELRGHLAAELAAGRTTLAEARKQLSLARLNSEREWATEMHQGVASGAIVELRLAEGEQDGEAQMVLAGILPEGLTEDFVFEGGAPGAVTLLLEPHPAIAPGDAIHAELAKLELQVARDLELGKITEAEADEHLAQARHEAHGKLMGGLLEGHAAALHERELDLAKAAHTEAAALWFDEHGNSFHFDMDDAFFGEAAQAGAHEHLERARHLDAAREELDARRAEVAAAIAAGRVSEDDAASRLEALEAQALDVERAIKDTHEGLRYATGKPHPAHDRRAHDVLAAEFTAAAKAKDYYRAKTSKARGQAVFLPDLPFGHGPARHHPADDAALLDAVRTHLDAEVAQGRLTAELARERLEGLRHAAKLSDAAAARADLERKHLHEAQAGLERAVRSGDLTREALLERLREVEAMVKALHEAKKKTAE